MSLRKMVAIVVFMFCAMAAPALAQPSQMRINLTISSPFELKGADVVLPAGKYVLFQLNPNDREVFALYQEDMTRPPVAILRTTRIQYYIGWLPDDTTLKLEINEGSPQLRPVLKGWDVPGDWGFEVIRVSVNRSRLPVTQAKR